MNAFTTLNNATLSISSLFARSSFSVLCTIFLSGTNVLEFMALYRL